jgi:hypothetical protein
VEQGVFNRGLSLVVSAAAYWLHEYARSSSPSASHTNDARRQVNVRISFPGTARRRLLFVAT